MPTVRFALAQDYYERLEEMAEERGMSLQDYIRSRLFDVETIYTPAEAVRRALEKYKPGDTFTLPDLYEGEWNLQRGPAGAFGKQFFAYAERECPDTIKFEKMVNSGRRAQYRRTEAES